MCSTYTTVKVCPLCRAVQSQGREDVDLCEESTSELGCVVIRYRISQPVFVCARECFVRFEMMLVIYRNDPDMLRTQWNMLAERAKAVLGEMNRHAPLDWTFAEESELVEYMGKASSATGTSKPSK